MRNMKKLKAIAVLLAMALMCTACGGKDDVAGQISGLENQDSSVESQTGTIEATEEDEATDDSEATEEAGATEEEVADTPLSLGRIQGGVYTNEYVGMACELDSSWTFYTAEELQDLDSLVDEMVEGSTIGDAIQNLEQFMDMQAENVDELISMNVVYQKLNMQQRLAYAVATEDEIIEQTLAQKDLLVESYAQAGIMVEEMTKKTITFMGEERAALWTKSTMEGIDYYTLQIMNCKLGQYSVTITLASFVEDKTENMLELFYAL